MSAASQLWRAVLQYHHQFCRVCSDGATLTRDFVIAVILIVYKLFVVAYRLTLGMIKDAHEETTVPDLIKANGYQVNTTLRNRILSFNKAR